MATVTAQLGEGTVVNIQARQFSWRGDEPISVGGTVTGANPYELLLGGGSPPASPLPSAYMQTTRGLRWTALM